MKIQQINVEERKETPERESNMHEKYLMKKIAF